MKLLRLSLLRYGHLTDQMLDFSAESGLHVVHGANEAGKSTALSAIADALFGFPHQTAFDFLHASQNLRIGFTLQAAGGMQAAFIRRKGKINTLRNDADDIVPEDELRPFLGTTGRDVFEQSFGLDGARLRAGGQELLRSGGEAAESFLASTGLGNLRLAMAALDERAKSLVGDGRGRRRLSEAVEAWRAAQRAADEAAVAPRVWAEAEAAAATAEADLAALHQQARALAEEDSRLHRVRRVKPVLVEIDDTRALLAGLADAPPVPADAGARHQAGLAAAREAAADLKRAREEHVRLSALLAALTRDAPAIAVQDAIDALAQPRAVAVQAAGDLPLVLAEIADNRARAEAAIEVIGQDLGVEEARDSLPPADARRAVQRLITQREGLLVARDRTRAALDAAVLRRDAARAALGAVEAPVPPARLRRTIDAVRSLGPLDAGRDRARRAVAQATQRCAAGLAALPLWSGDLAGLVACALPLPSACSDSAGVLESAQAALAQLRQVAAGLRAEAAAVDRDLARLAAGQVVPTPEAVAARRSFRDRAWREIRRAIEGTGERPTPAMADDFETERDAADRLADRRADEAQRVAEYLAATARRAMLDLALSASAATLTEAEQAQAAAIAGWAALWAAAGVQAQAPAAMAEWRRAREDVLELAAAAAAARETLADVEASWARAAADLAGVLPPGVTADTLGALLLRADELCAAMEAECQAYQDRVQALAKEDRLLPELRRDEEAARAGLAAWGEAWAQAVGRLGLPGDATTDAVEAALQGWARIAEIAPVWRKDESRVADMRASLACLAAAVEQVQHVLGEPGGDEPASVAAARLARRVAQARAVEAEAEGLARSLAGLERNMAAASERLRAAEADLAALRDAVGVQSDSELTQAIEIAAQRGVGDGRLAALGHALLAQGDGLTEAELRAESVGVGPDEAVARLDDIKQAREALDGRREVLSEVKRGALARMDAMQQGGLAAAKAQDAEDALAEAREAAELYARVHVARTVLRAGIERFREAQQGPLLRAASAHFAMLTGGRYARLVLDEDGSGRTVLQAVRPDGGACPMGSLSEGTRDQLFLALRVAAIELYVARGQVMPVVADDVLVQFDDVRARAAIGLLAELGRTTQVILFTHHEHVVDLARGVAAITRLGVSVPDMLHMKHAHG